MKEAELAAEAGRVGARFRLGQPAGTWTATWFRRRAGCGVALLVGLLFTGWLPAAFLSGTGFSVAIDIEGAIFVLGIVLAVIPPIMWLHRLHRYDLGIAFVDPKYP